MNGFPCWRCGSASSCAHRDAPRPVRIEDPPTNVNKSGGRYALPRGAYNGLASRITQTGTAIKPRKD